MFHKSCHTNLKNQVHVDGMINFNDKGTKQINRVIQFFCHKKLRQIGANANGIEPPKNLKCVPSISLN